MQYAKFSGAPDFKLWLPGAKTAVHLGFDVGWVIDQCFSHAEKQSLCGFAVSGSETEFHVLLSALSAVTHGVSFYICSSGYRGQAAGLWVCLSCDVSAFLAGEKMQSLPRQREILHIFAVFWSRQDSTGPEPRRLVYCSKEQRAWERTPAPLESREEREKTQRLQTVFLHLVVWWLVACQGAVVLFSVVTGVNNGIHLGVSQGQNITETCDPSHTELYFSGWLSVG